ncbi:C4-dicarboxylate ABC transporter [Halomonas cupida]|uniref:TRAP transporter small permease protein n=1 Tax=Halomonas cupida TaxID=44933 RepID=A0A1M6ZH52_9GAMM|nr:TRAP transporter small permease [Halomonas cupida]GEN24365.1 C4-dicarboxylate ABC transporter [Halomonas cupida]SHL29812.1 TRAP-type C4-dicarboxylate transport system, small permease component [Halomonas cupida]
MKLSEESLGSEAGQPASLLQGSKNAIYQLFKWVAIISIVTMFASLMSGVVVRYVLSTSLGWVSEVPNLFFPWLTMSAIVAAAARNEHIGVEVVVGSLPSTLRRIIALAVNGLAVVAFSVMAWYGLDVIAIAGNQTLPITGIAMSWAYWSVVVGFAAVALVSLINIAQLLKGESVHPPELVTREEVS